MSDDHDHPVQRTDTLTFAELSAWYLEPLSQWIMIFGIVALCQPWVEVLHRYGVTIILVGLVGFSIFSKFKPPPRQTEATDHG